MKGYEKQIMKDTYLRNFGEGYVIGDKNFILNRQSDYKACAAQFS
jgi:hypothetical protein